MLDKAFATVDRSANQASAAFSKQKSNVAQTKAELAALKAQADAAAQSLARLRSGDAVVAAGRNQGPRLAQIKAVEAEQVALSASTAKLTRVLGQQEAAIESSRSSLQRLGSTTIAVEQAQSEATARIQNTTQALNEQAAAAQHVSAIQQRINAATGVSRPSAAGSAAASASILVAGDDAFRSREQMVREAAALRNELNPLTVIQERLNTQLARYKQLAAAGVITTQELAAAEAHLAIEAQNAEKYISRTGGPKLGAFGLKPYELQNLGYQVNDVVTQLASGTKLSQVLAQQGGQILQLFPRVGGSIVSALSNPYVLAAAATFGVIALGIKSAADQAERLRHYTAALDFRADGGQFKASDLVAQEQALKALGNSAEDARAAVTTFLDSGIAPDKLNAFSAAAQNLADIMGIKLPDAATQVSTAFSGGYEAIAKLDDKLNFLTATEREEIRALFESGQAAKGRTEAFRIFEDKADDIAGKSRGPWSDATRSLETAWSRLTETLGNTAWAQAAIDAVNTLANALDLAAGGTGNLQGKIDGLGGASSAPPMPTGFIPVDTARAAGYLVGTARDSFGREVQREDQAGSGSALKSLGGSLFGQPRSPADFRTSLTPTPRSSDTVSTDPNSARSKQADDQVHKLNDERELQALRDAGETRILSLREQNRRAELAGIEASRNAENETVAAALRRNAVEKETAKISRETDARQKAALQRREANIKHFEERVVGAEGGTARNPHSTAKGFGQFTEGTFLENYAKIPGLNQNLGRAATLDLRNDPKIAAAVLDKFTRTNAQYLEKYGQVITAGNLYLAHFLGNGTALAVLQARKDAPVDEVIRRADPKGAATVLSGNQQYLRTENGKGRYRTAGELQTFIAGRVGDTGNSGGADGGIDPGVAEADRIAREAAAEQERIAKRNIERQNNLTYAVEQTNEERKRSIETQQAESGLTGTALLDERRRQEVANAEYDLKKRAADANKNLQPGDTVVTVTDDEISKAKAFSGALFDEVHAQERLAALKADAERPINDLQTEIGLLREKADWLRSIGDNKSADAIDKQVVTLNASLREAIAKLQEFYKALTPEQRIDLGILDQAQFDNLLASLDQASEKTQQFGKIAGLAGEDVAHAFASSASTAFTNFIGKVAQGKNVFRSLGESILEFASNFAGAIAQMIIQLLAYAAVVAILKALGVSVPAGGGGGLFGGIFAGKNHGGGMAGSAGMHRISPAVFAGAMRFHNGGIVGLGPNEVPIIAKRDEEVLTSMDPRHRNNGGLSPSGGSGGGLNILNVFDPNEVAEMMLRTPAGEKTLLNFISQNRAAVSAALR